MQATLLSFVSAKLLVKSNYRVPLMLERSYYQSAVSAFLVTSDSFILGELSRKNQFSLELQQKNAWLAQIANLKEQLVDIRDGEIFFEFSIPRMGKRVDIVLLIGGVVWVIEYKVGATTHDRHSIDQTMDYALDLKNFHEGSHDKYIVPILISTHASQSSFKVEWTRNRVASPLLLATSNLGEMIRRALIDIPPQNSIDANEWVRSGYKPTPTIVEAARALYEGHSVEEISRSDAGAANLTLTARCVFEIIEHSKRNGRKAICFITGVPGAGKTLAGLNISTRLLRAKEEESSVFLSGNGPLVNVLREALAIDEVERAKESGQNLSKKEAKARVNTFIQNIHHFRDEGLRSTAAPTEHVIVFDEAQRAWNRLRAEQFMIQKKGLTKFEESEPEFLIGLMDRRQDWCTIVCLIGGGQEINTGEAGLTEWFDALRKRFDHWDIYHSDQIAQKEYSWGQDLEPKIASLKSQRREALHLAVSVRSFRAENVSAFVSAIIDGDSSVGRKLYDEIHKSYPVTLTRDIRQARTWLRSQATGTERIGLVASSGAIRLKPDGIAVKSDISPIHWFLGGKNDVRSSYYLEDVATEFDIQGLELDWTGVCWDADFRRKDDNWSFNDFKGTRWQGIKDQFRRAYLANAYRVLLTRARQGMVIFVPKGDDGDHTRPAKFYDDTYAFLSSLNIEKI